MVITRKGYNLSGFSAPLDATPAKTVAPTPVKTPVTTPAPKPATWDTPTQAQKPVKTVTPVTPTPTPNQQGITTKNLDGSPTSIKLDMPSKIDPKTGNMFNADGSKYVPGPNSTMNPTKIQDTTQTTPVKTAAKKPLDAGLSTDGLDYQAQDQARLNEIQANLTSYSQTSPEMFKTRDAFDANFKYGERSDEQKKVLDNFYKEYQLKQGNPDFVYQTLMSGGSIDPKFQNSAGFQQGYEKYQKISMFSSMSAKQLAGQLGKKIIIGSSEWQELAKINPQLAQEALEEKNKLDAEKSVNGTYTDLSGLESDRIPEIDVITESLAKLYDKLGSLNIDLAEEYRVNVLENPVINDRYKAMEERSRNIAEMQSIRDRAIDDAYASAGGAPDSVIRARANMQYKALNNQISLMQADQEIDQAMLSTDIERFTGMYNAKIDEYNQEVSMFQEQAQYVTGIAETVAGAYKDQREAKLAEQQAQVQFERDMAMQQAEQEYQITRDDQAYERDVELANIKYNQDLEMLNLKHQNDIDLAKQKAQAESGVTTGGATTNATQLISRWEGFRDKAYQDSAGVWTVGFGFTNLNGRPVQPGDTIDRASAEALLEQEISQRQNFMNYITVPLSENQKAALSSFEYNLGSGIWDKNAKPILDKVNQGDLAGAATLMKQYTNAGGKQVKGLVNRRNEEAQLLQSTTQQQSFDPNRTSQYINFVENGSLPSGMTAGKPETDQFISVAREGYLAAKEKTANAAKLTIKDPDAFIGIDPETRKTVNRGLSSLPAFENTMDELIALVKEYGTETLPGPTSDKMRMLVRNAQLQAKEIYNLGVLNGPDLELMEQIILDPTKRGAATSQFFGLGRSYYKALSSAKEQVLGVGYSNASQIGLARIGETNSTTGATTGAGSVDDLW